MNEVRADGDSALERAIAAHRRAIDKYIVLDWRDKEAIERECLREALHEQAARARRDDETRVAGRERAAAT
jgi:hypothetical protein